MKNAAASALMGALLVLPAHAAPAPAPVVDETYPYTGPAIPVGDWVDPTVNGNGKGFPRLVEPPAVKPASANPTNNVNVIQISYMPNGINVHYQTPFGLGQLPSVHWGTNPHFLTNRAVGSSTSYNRTPPCSLVKAVTQCSEFFHDVKIDGLQPDTTYYYQIPGANGTTQSDVLTFTTARAAGESTGFTIAILNDMGYTNAKGTHQYLAEAIDEGIAFAWHGGDISYADDWYSGVLPCQLTGDDSWPVCYNGTDTSLPGNGPIPDEYKVPLPAGEVPNQGGPQGGDISPIYENNWDLWQQWMNDITTRVPYMVLPGNHEPSCAEFDGGPNVLTAYLNDDHPNGTAPEDGLTYYSCPPSQRNFTAYQHRFKMPGGQKQDGSVSNFWYSFDYGLAHFVAISTETDFAYSPEWPFIADTDGKSDHPTEEETFITDSGPFGQIDDNNYKDNKAYQQYQWLTQDLAAVDRSVTPWVIVMGHRPMYSSQVSTYQSDIRNAFEELMLQNGVDMYLSGHIHWYERMVPMGFNRTAVFSSMKNNNTYYSNHGVSMTHIVNGMAGNIESHSELDGDPVLDITQVLDTVHYGFSKLSVLADKIEWGFVKGDGSGYGDVFTLLKQSAPTTSSSSISSTATSTSSASSSTSSVAFTNSTSSSASATSTSSVILSNTTNSSASFSSTSASSVIYGNTTTSSSGSSTPTSSVAYGSSSTSSISGMTSSSTQYTTSTVYTTVVRTVTSCAPTVTNCPAGPHVTTEVIIDYTTVCPVTAETSSPVPASSSPAVSVPAVVSTPATLSVPGAVSVPPVVVSTSAALSVPGAISVPPVVSSPAGVSVPPASSPSGPLLTTSIPGIATGLPTTVETTPPGSSVPVTAGAGRMVPAAGLAGLLGLAVLAL